MSAEDGFEEELARRLGLRAAAVGGSPPMAALKAAGRRRARQQGAVRGVTAVAVLAVGAGAVTQLGGGGSSAGEGVGGGPAGVPTRGAATPSAGWTWSRGKTMIFACDAGPSSLRTPGLHFHPTPPPSSPLSTPSSVLSSPGRTTSSGPALPPPTIGVGSTTPGSTTPGSPSPLSSAQSMQADLLQASEAVDRMASAGHRDRYLGVCHDFQTDTLYVMRVPGGGDLEDAVARVLVDWPAVKLRFTDAAGSFDELTALANRINGDRTYWQDKGVQLQLVGVANDGSGVVVDTPQWESAGAQIKEKYGPQVVEVR